MSIDELKQKIQDLRDLQDAITDLNHHMETVEDLCAVVRIEGSHHASIEYGRAECAVADMLQEIENKLSLLGVEI